MSIYFPSKYPSVNKKSAAQLLRLLCISPEIPDGRSTGSSPWQNVENAHQCIPAFTELKHSFQFIVNQVTNIKLFESTFMANASLYQKNVEKIYGDSTVNVSSLTPHVQCLQNIDEASNIESKFMTVLESATNMIKSETITEAYAFGKQVQAGFKKTTKYNRESLTQLDNTLHQTCLWLQDAGQKTQKARARVTKIMSDMKVQGNTVLKQFESLTDLFKDLHREITEKIKPTVSKVEEYMDKRLSKKALSSQFDALSFTKALADLSDINSNILEILKDYTTNMVLGLEKMKFAFDLLFSLKFPVLKNHRIKKLEFVKAAATINDTIILELVNSIKDHPEVKIRTLLEETYKRLTAPIVI